MSFYCLLPADYCFMPRILLVEDDESRCEWFRARLVGYELDVTCDVREAVAWLDERTYEAILLDHDLRDEHYFSDEPDDERTGYAVASWLAVHPDRQRKALIIIHSLNYSGALRMRLLLQDAGRDAECIPFHHLENRLKF